MKKIFTLALVCLWLLPMWGQQPEIPDGTYLFEKAELFIRNYQTKEQVEHKVLTDTASIKLNDNFHLQNIFLEVKIKDGRIVETVMPDRQRYRVEAEILHPAIEIDEKIKEFIPEEEKAKYLYSTRDLQPYELKVEGDKLVFAYLVYTFGQTGINFTMEAELTAIMTKQKENETDNI